MRVPLPDGVHLRVRDEGRGPATLLLHGFTGSVEAWGEEVIGGLVDAGQRVLAVDLPGHGRSDVPDDPARYALHEVVADLATVMDFLDVSRADWIGYSMGGRVALGAAVLQPELIRRLVLEGASPGIAEEAVAARRRERDEDRALRVLTGSMEEFVDDWLDQPLFGTREELPPDVRRRERKRRLACDPVGLAAALRGLGTGRQPSFWEDLPGVDVPTLVLTGGEDRKFEELARRMCALLPNSVHRSVPGAGHTVHLERTGAWLRIVIGFLSDEDRHFEEQANEHKETDT